MDVDPTVDVVRAGAVELVVATTGPWKTGAAVDGGDPGLAADVDVVGAGTVVKKAVSDGEVEVVVEAGLAARTWVRS